MEKFEQLKSEFADKCKQQNACSTEFKKLLASKNEEELLQVIFNNLGWCKEKKVISYQWLENFSPEALLKSGLANTGKENTGYSNSGDRNSGSWNSGDRNSGSWNSGDRNSGDSNSGYRNSGDSNSGYRNSGDRNSGDSNSGYRNSGDRNSGDSNSGYRNSGSWNSGDRNSGDSNSGYRNSGAFCTNTDPVLYLFDLPTNMTVRQWENHTAVRIMLDLDPTIWVPAHAMSDEEKEQHPKWETTEGYLKTISMKEAWANLWHNMSDDNKKVFLTLPNFNAEKFETITGIKVEDDKGAKTE